MPDRAPRPGLRPGVVLSVVMVALAACAGTPGAAATPPGEPAMSVADDPFASARRRMVAQQIAARGVRDQAVLAAMGSVPRERFVPAAQQAAAYQDRPLPIAANQTISQPYIVAVMTELARLRPPCRVLEVGTGSGYQAAVLAAMGCRVHSIEIIGQLSETAGAALAALGYAVELRVGDGYAGWPEAAPFDAILVTAAAPRVPPALVEQLAVGGRLVLPVGEGTQDLVVVTRTATGSTSEVLFGVRFVPMTGEVRQPAPR